MGDFGASDLKKLREKSGKAIEEQTADAPTAQEEAPKEEEASDYQKSVDKAKADQEKEYQARKAAREQAKGKDEGPLDSAKKVLDSWFK